MALTELVQNHQESERVLAEFEDYWDRHYLMMAATSTDWWLLVDCTPGDTHGRVGVWSGGDGVHWTEWA